MPATILGMIASAMRFSVPFLPGVLRRATPARHHIDRQPSSSAIERRHRALMALFAANAAAPLHPKYMHSAARRRLFAGGQEALKVYSEAVRKDILKRYPGQIAP
jgi:hypothetical protein